MDDISNNNNENVSNDLDQEKLAKLKAKLEAKRDEKMTKLEVKKERSINFGVVGSGQAGCIDGNTNIYVSGDGITTIKEFFDKKISVANLTDIEITNDKSTCIHLNDEIYTVSIDPESGEIKKGKITAVWKNRAESKNKITTNSGVNLICSKIHPSLTFRPQSRRRAFFMSLSSSKPLSVNDNLVDTRLTVLDELSQKTYVRNIEITEDIAWLVGALVGDGHNKLSGNEISFYSDDKGFTKRIVKVSKQLPHTSISINDRPGCKQIAVFGLQFRLFMESVFEQNNTQTFGGTGSKTYTISIPKCISAGTSKVRAAFLAGLIDSDGTVNKDWCETSVFTCSYNLADKLGCLISSIGGRSAILIHNSKRENEHVGYRVRLYGKLNHGPMAEFIVSQLSHSRKNKRLKKWLMQEQKSFTNSSVPIKFQDMSYWLKREGKITTTNALNVKANINTKSWSRGERQLSIPVFNKMLGSLANSEQLDYVKVISPRLTEIQSIELIDDSESTLYDLTVEKYENYVAGNNGFIFTHNSRIAETFYKLGVDAVAINTATQDLKYIEIPDSNKLLLDYGLGGAAKDIAFGRAAAEQYRDQILELVTKQLADSQILILCLSLGGGSGAGSCETMVDILTTTNKPLMVITVLPMDSEDSQTKNNALQTLSLLAQLVKSKRVNNLFIVDNAKLESIYHNVSQLDFYNVANKAIVGPIDAFNTFSSMDSSVKGLDPMEVAKLFTDGDGLSVYGELKVTNYADEMAIADAMVNNLDSNLLASGFDLKETKYAGIIIAANKAVWSKIPSSSINYALSMVNEQCGSPKGVFKGIYEVDMPDDCVIVYSMFSGLGLPAERTAQLKKEALEFSTVVKAKETQRNLALNLDTGTSQVVTDVQKIKEKITASKSAFGKLTKATIVDRRK